MKRIARRRAPARRSASRRRVVPTIRRASNPIARRSSPPARRSATPVRFGYRRRVNPLAGRGLFGSAAVRLGGAAVAGAIAGSIVNAKSPAMLAEWAGKLSVQPSTLVAIITIIAARFAPAGARQYVVAAGVGMLAPEAVARVGQLGTGAPATTATAAELRRRANAYKAQIQARRQNTLEGSANAIPMAPARKRADLAS